MSPDETSLAADRLVGVKAIAEALGTNERRVRHLISLGVLPTAREGALIVASRRRLHQDWLHRTGQLDRQE